MLFLFSLILKLISFPFLWLAFSLLVFLIFFLCSVFFKTPTIDGTTSLLLGLFVTVLFYLVNILIYLWSVF